MPRAALTVCRQLCAALLLLLPSLQGLAQEAVAPARVTWLVVVAVCVIGLIVATLYWWDRRPRVAAAALVLLALGAAGLFEAPSAFSPSRSMARNCSSASARCAAASRA